MLKKAIKYYLILLVVGIVALLIYFYKLDIPLCLFKSRLNIPCPGCGLTRAYVSFLSGDIIKAFSNHPLFWTIPFLPNILSTENNKLIITVSTIFILTWIFRLLTTYPAFY